MKGIRKMKMERRRIPIYLLLIGVFMVGLLAFRWGMMSEADDVDKYTFSILGLSEKIAANGKYELAEQEKEISFYKEGGLFIVENWSVDRTDIVSIDGTYNSVNTIKIKAKGVGKAVLSAKIRDGVDEKIIQELKDILNE